MLNIILFGPPGSGKGTQAKRLSKSEGLVHISTGDLFRAEMKEGTPLGKKAKDYITKGELVPDEVTIGMLKNKVQDHPEANGFIFDGFPRTKAQAKALDDLLDETGYCIDALIALEVPEQEIVRRILERGKSSGRTDDSDEEIIRKRYEVYQKETAPVFEYYEEAGIAYRIDGKGTVDEIYDRLTEAIDEAQA
jgi:adenylate kinase